MLRCSRIFTLLTPKYIYAHSSSLNMPISNPSQGDLNNTSAARPHVVIEEDPEYRYRSLAISENDDDAKIRAKYRPFLLEKNPNVVDWVEHLELATVTKMALVDMQKTNERVKVLVLYGSLRQRFVANMLQMGFF